MTLFFNIAPGFTKRGPGLRVEVTARGDRVWMHGKWLELGPEHAVIWAEHEMSFVRPDGRRLRPGQFPAWVVAGRGRRAPFAAMTSITQFRGGEVVTDGVRTCVPARASPT